MLIRRAAGVMDVLGVELVAWIVFVVEGELTLRWVKTVMGTGTGIEMGTGTGIGMGTGTGIGMRMGTGTGTRTGTVIGT